MAGIVVADAGPLIAFSSVHQLELLKKLFGQVVVPNAVVDESLYENRSGAASIQEALDEGWLRQVDKVSNKELWAAPPSLGKGEIAAIGLALHSADSLLILDDRLARREALRLGVQLVGTVKVLVVAEQHGVIADAGLVVRQMIGNGYRISLELLKQVKQAGWNVGKEGG